MWFDAKEQRALTGEHLIELMMNSEHQIILLDGPTGCGKTMLLRKMKEKAQMIMLPEEDFVLSMLTDASERVRAVPFKELVKGYEVICAEDIDLLTGKTAVQQIAAQCLSEAARHALVIVTGIKLRERVKEFIEALEGKIRLIEYRTTV